MTAFVPDVEQSVKDAAEEAASLKSEGFKAMKMFVGLLPIRQDLQRVSAVREAIGPEVCLLSSVVFTFVFKESSSSSVSIYVCRWASWWTPTMPTLCRQQFVLPGVFICLDFCGYLFDMTFLFTLNCLADLSAPLKSTTSAGSRSPSFLRISKVIKTLGVKPRLLYLEEKEAS